MKDQLVMAANGNCAVAIPLFRMNYDSELADLPGYSIALTNEKPIGYLLDCGDNTCPFLRADFVENNLEFLGDL